MVSNFTADEVFIKNVQDTSGEEIYHKGEMMVVLGC